MKRFLSAFVILSAVSIAQTYTIDSSMPASGLNFTNFADAVTFLSVGITAPVNFIVSPGTGPYAGFAIVNPITGSSALNPITFSAAGAVVISGAAPTFTQAVRLGAASVTVGTGPSYITFDGFSITGAATGAGFIATRCDNITIRNCIVSACGSGICFNANTNSVIEDNEVFSCGVTVGIPGSPTYAGGISSYYLNNTCLIQRNRVHDCTNQGIFVGSSGSATACANNTIVNNMVWNCPGTGTYPGGIAIRRSGLSVISNNSVSMPAGSSIGGINLTGGAADPQPAEISNNVVRHNGTGPCFRFESTATPATTIFDYNVYDPAPTAFVGGVGATNYATLAAWQAVAAPNLSTKELNTVAGNAGFLTTSDLHITPASLAFNSGSAVAAVTLDIDLQLRPIAGIPDRGADETPATGLFASFTATPVSGPAPLTVNFTDATFTSDPGGVLTWAWDFTNDGINDSSMQNPSFTYLCPGTYSVRLSVTDASNPANSLVRTNFVTVSNYIFDLTTTGMGVGDLTVNPVPAFCYPTAVEGYTLLSFLTNLGPVNTGPFAGIYPDVFTIQFLLQPAVPGNPLHFIVTPGTYPNVPFSVPAGTFTPLTGATMDAVEVLLSAGGTIVYVSNVDRVMF